MAVFPIGKIKPTDSTEILPAIPDSPPYPIPPLRGGKYHYR